MLTDSPEKPDLASVKSLTRSAALRNERLSVFANAESPRYSLLQTRPSTDPVAITRPLRLIGLAAAIPVIILAAWIAFVNARHDRTDARIRASNALERVAVELRLSIKSDVDAFARLADSEQVLNGDAVQFRLAAESALKANPGWKQISIVSSDGTEQLGSSLGQPHSVGNWVQEKKAGALQHETKRDVSVEWRNDGSRSYYLLFAAVTKASQPGASLVTVVATDALTAILSEATRLARWSLVLRDRNGRVVARSKALEDDSSTGWDSDKSDINAGRKTAEGGPTKDDTEEIAVPLLGATGWSVELSIPSADLNRDVFRTVALLIASAGVGLVLAMILAWYSAREITLRKAEDEARAKRALSISEERRILAISAAQLGVFSWDKVTESLMVSRRTCELLELPVPEGEDVSLTVEEVLSSIEDTGQRTVRRLLSDWTATKATKEAVIDFRTRSGRWLRLSGRSNGDRRSTFGVVRDVDAEKKLENERLQLIRRVSEAQENDRKRISRELHDQVGQLVTGLLLGLKKLELGFSGAAEGRARVEDVKWLSKLAGDIGRDIHRAAADLRPAELDHLGLDDALDTLCSDWSRQTGLRIDLQSIGGRRPLLPDVEIALFRIVQEALSNVLKHAKASNVSVVLERRGTFVRVIVEDDGDGFDQRSVEVETGRAQPLGLTGIQERLALLGGHLTIETGLDRGTTLFIVVPSA